MTRFALIAALLISTNVRAGTTLKIPNGDCRGRGQLVNAMAPDFAFVSSRDFFEGWIRAKTTVELLGHPVSAKANLVFREHGAKLEVFDMDQPEGMFFKRVGRGACNATACRFDATVMGGKLYLRETIVPTARGFDIVDGFQKLYGVTGTYRASFVCKPTPQAKPSQLSQWIEAFRVIKTIPEQMRLTDFARAGDPDAPAEWDISQPPLQH